MSLQREPVGAGDADADMAMLDDDDVDEVIDDGDEVNDLGAGVENLDAGDDNDDDAEDADMDEGEAAPEDMSRGKFSQHSGYVLSVAWHPSGQLVASGGEDDKGFTWDANDGQKKLELGGHSDSVVKVAFNRDGSLVATGAMNGIILVRNVSDGEVVCELDCGSDLTWFDWHPVAQFIIAGTADSGIYMWDVPGANMSFFSGHGLTVTCGGWAPSGRNFMSAGEDGALIVWSPKTGQSISKTDGKKGNQFHSDAINCSAWAPNGDLIATGGQDGVVCVTQPKTGKVVARFQLDNVSIESVGFSKTLPLFLAVGDLNGALYIFDVNSQRKIHKLDPSDGVAKLLWSKTKPNVMCCTLNGKFQVWNTATGTCEKELSGHVGNILDFDVSGDETKVVTCGEDGQCRIFDI